jgi:PAS domain S-box-containing protein
MPGGGVLQRLIDALTVAAFVADSHGRFVAANRHAAELTGYTVAELRLLSVWQITPGVNEHQAETLWRAFLSRGEQSGEYHVLGRGGRIIKARYAALTDLLPGFHVSLLQRIEEDG